MPVTINFMERLILLRLNMGPGPMLDLLGSYRVCVLRANALVIGTSLARIAWHLKARF